MSEIKSSLLNEKDLKYVKHSIETYSENDDDQKFKVNLVEYINDSSYEEDDTFFYNMLEFVRFWDEDNPDEFKKSIAYTKPDRRIYLNSPGDKVGKNVRIWEFIYDHECLHQLWDTFEVEKRIQNEGLPYDHDILNIASDCVINDYLVRRKKEPFKDGVFPEYLEEKFGVVFNRKTDTQYSLYLKLMEHQEEIKQDEKLMKEIEEMNKKIKPKSVNKQHGPTPPPPPPGGKHSEDYKRGWTDAIKDVLDKKIDPLKDTPKSSGNNEYDQGYGDAIKQIKQGLEQGINISDNPPPQGGGGDLPNIPWDLPQEKGGQSDNQKDAETAEDAQEAADQAQDAADEAKEAAKEAKQKADESSKNGDSDADKKQKEAKDAAKEANEAQKQADKAKQAAQASQKAKDRGDSNKEKSEAKNAQEAAQKAKDAAARAKGNSDNSSQGNMNNAETAEDAQDAADQAKEAADKAQDAADKAQDAADKAKQNGDSDAKEKQAEADQAQEAADKAKEAADKAQEAADKAQEAKENGDKEGEKEAAKEAQDAANEAQKQSDKAEGKESSDNNSQDNQQNNSKPQWGKGKGDSKTFEEDVEAITKKAEKIIESYKKKISGLFGEFIRKCKSSYNVEKTGLATKALKANRGWNQDMNQIINTYVKKVIFNKKREYKTTYQRVRRGSGAVRLGQPISPGKKIKKDNLDITVAFYIDRSGSMGGCIDNVFKAAYTICEALKRQFSKEKVVSDIEFKMFAFDDYLHTIKFGQSMSASGGTMAFHELLSHIIKHTKEFLINVIITDAGFEVNEAEITKFLKELDGIVIFIENMGSQEVKTIAEKTENKTKLFYIKADSDFTIK